MLDKNTNARHFKLLSDIYFQNMCYVTSDFSKENSALLCFLDAFGIAVPVFIFMY